jgi:beta-glucosidase
MSAYNSVNGTPAAADPYLIDTLLRETFGFDGYVTSDCDAIYEIQHGHHWQPPGWTRPVNEIERHAFAMSAGEDLDCNAGYHDAFSYANTLPQAVAQRIRTLTDTFSENDVDTALVRLFTARMKLGEFDDPATVPWVREARARVPQGTWVNSDANHAVTETPQRLALAREAADKSIVLLENRSGRLPLRVPRSGPYRVAVMGFFAHPPAAQLYLGGYSSLQGPAGQANDVDGYEGIKRAVRAIDPDARVDFYRGFTGTGTTAESLTAVDPAAVEAARDYDAVVVYVGTDAGTATEDRDRTDLALPGAQASLIEQVAARNPNTVAYMETIGPVDVTPFKRRVGALLWSSYNGQRKGEALADVLLGRYDPSARVPSIWYRSAAQIPPITDYAIRPGQGNPGRTYMYFRGPLAYPFGYGRSYTRFRFSALRLATRRLDANGALRLRFRVTNTGRRSGSAVPELYVSTPDAPAALQRPIKRLEGFRQVHLAPGQARTVRMRVRVRDLAFYEGGRAVVDRGRYVVQIATSSADRDIALRRSFFVHGHLEPVPAVVTAKPTMRGDAARDVASRVMFPAGAVVHPKLTVALSDDRLFGYVRKGHSRAFPRGMRFAYASDRPSVVSVDRRGVIRTVSAGVATVTATAIFHGHRRSTSFVVHVA